MSRPTQAGSPMAPGELAGQVSRVLGEAAAGWAARSSVRSPVHLQLQRLSLELPAGAGRDEVAEAVRTALERGLRHAVGRDHE